MKSFLLLLVFVGLNFSSFGAEHVKTMSAEWLRNGLMLEKRKNDGKPLSATEVSERLSFISWFRGWIDGVLVIRLAFEEKDRDILDPAAMFPTPKEAMVDLDKFIAEHRNVIPDDFDASRVVLAWYLVGHPKATVDQKVTGLSLLKWTDDEWEKWAKAKEHSPVRPRVITREK